VAQREIVGAAALSRTRSSRLFYRPRPALGGMTIGYKLEASICGLAESACGRMPKACALLHHLPARDLQRARRRAVETKPRRLDLGLAGAMAARPHLGGGGRVFGDVIPDRRA
jgi:hypothetical protein